MIFSIVILLLISVTASKETTKPAEFSSPGTQTPTDMTSGDTSETLTTTQQITIQQTTTDVTDNTQTTSSQSTWMPQKSLLTTSESPITTVNSTETFSEKSNSTVTAQGDREVQDVAVNPGLIAVLCIFSIVMAVVVVVVIVKAVRSRRPHFERLDDVSMGKISEDAPFAHYPPK